MLKTQKKKLNLITNQLLLRRKIKFSDGEISLLGKEFVEVYVQRLCNFFLWKLQTFCGKFMTFLGRSSDHSGYSEKKCLVGK